MNDPIFPGNQARGADDTEGLAARIMRLELMLAHLRIERVHSADENGSVNQYEVLARRVGSSPGLQDALSPYFVVEDGKLYGLVSPHAMLSPDLGEIHRPVMATMGGKNLDADPPPREALSDGQWWLVLRGGHGVARVAYEKEEPKRDGPVHAADWVILADFTVEEKTKVTKLRRHNTAVQHGMRRPGGFMPLLWRDGNTWKARSFGHLIDRTKMNPIKAELSATVEEGDRFYLKVATGPDGEATAATLIHVKRTGKLPENKQHFPKLDRQAARNGEYNIKICTFVKTDESGKDDDNNPIFTLKPDMEVSGDIVWQPESFENIGGGEGKLLAATAPDPRRLKVKSIRKGVKDQIKVVNNAEDVTVEGNGIDGALYWENCSGYRTKLIEWKDGLIVTPGDVAFKAGCPETSTEAPGPP